MKKEKHEIDEVDRLITRIFKATPLTEQEKNQVREILRNQDYQKKIENSIAGFLGESRDSQKDLQDGRSMYELVMTVRKEEGLRAVSRPVSLSARRLLKVAAVLIPVSIVMGAVWFFLNSTPTQAPDKPVELAEKGVELPVPPEAEPESEPAKPPVENRVVPVPAPKQAHYETTLAASPEKHKFIQLPDHTTVLLQKGSRIAFSSDHREVFLQGEAFFRVEKGHRRPLLVNTGGMTVEVTGTQFNVQAWPGGESHHIDLVDGSVDVRIEDKKINLEPREKLTYRSTDGMLKLSPSDANGWWKEPIRFNGALLGEILEEIENYYDISISGKEEIKDTTRYTITFDKMSTVEQILDVMHDWLEYRKDTSGITVIVRKTDN